MGRPTIQPDTTWEYAQIGDAVMQEMMVVRPCTHCQVLNRVWMNKLVAGMARCGMCGHELAVTHYDVLGVSSSASMAEIKRAYRVAALAWHPDRNTHPEAATVFRQVMLAYRVLSNPAHRQAYDTLVGRDLKSAKRAEHAGAEPTADATHSASRSKSHAESSEDTASTQTSKNNTQNNEPHNTQNNARNNTQNSTPNNAEAQEPAHPQVREGTFARSLTEFSMTTLISFVGIILWAMNHILNPEMAYMTLAIGVIIGSFGTVRLLYYVTTGRTWRLLPFRHIDS